MIQWESEWYTDVNELRALCQLVGPYGVRVIDRALLGIVNRHVSAIKDIANKNRPITEILANRFTEQQLWRENVVKLQGMMSASEPSD